DYRAANPTLPQPVPDYEWNGEDVLQGQPDGPELQRARSAGIKDAPRDVDVRNSIARKEDLTATIEKVDCCDAEASQDDRTNLLSPPDLLITVDHSISCDQWICVSSRNIS